MPKLFKDLVLTSAECCPDDPVQVIDEFCSNFTLDNIHDQLNEFLLHYLTSNDSLPKTGHNNSNAIFFCEQVWFASQAIHLLRHKILFPKQS